MSKLYLADDSGHLYSVDPVSLDATLVGTTSTVMTDIAFAPNGVLYGISLTALYKINPTNAQTLFIGNLGMNAANALGITAQGVAYAAEGSGGGFYTIDLASGFATLLGRNALGVHAAGDITFHGGATYVSTDTKLIAKVDVATGAFISTKADGITDLFGLADIGGLTYGFAGKTMYAVDPDSGASQILRTLTAPGLGVVNGAASDDFVQPSTSQVLTATFGNVLRHGATGQDGVYLQDLINQVNTGTITQFGAISQIVQRADATTSVATLAYEFFTGLIPTAAGYDYLVSPNGPNPNNLNSAYYQSFSLENRYINFAVNLGKFGEGQANFGSHYGTLSLFDATRQAYNTIFGSPPTDAKLHLLLDTSFQLNGQTLTRAEYFAYYGQDGANGIGTKAAMVGWLLGEAIKADVGSYALASNAFLTDLVDGAPYHVDLVGEYGRPEFAYLSN